MEGLRQRSTPLNVEPALLATTAAWALFGAARRWFRSPDRIPAPEMATQIGRMLSPDLRKVTVQVDPSKQVLVEVAGRELAGRQGFLVPTQGKLVNDLTGTGPGGSIVLARAGSPVQLSVFNSQRNVRVNLNRVGSGTDQIADFRGTFKELLPGVDTLPRDNGPVTVSFTLPPGIRQTMGLTDFEMGKTATFSGTGGGATAPAVREFGGVPGRAPANADARKVMLAGTLLHVELASPITVDCSEFRQAVRGNGCYHAQLRDYGGARQ